MSPKQILVSLTPVYVALGPVYWFFFLPPTVFNLFKYAFAILLVGATIFFGIREWSKDRLFVKNSSVLLVIGLIFCSLPGLFFNQSADAIGVISRYLILMGLLIGLYWLCSESKFLQRLPWVISFVMMPLGILTTADFLLNLGLISYDPQFRLHATGFSTTRTQWSGGLACVALFLYWNFVLRSGKGKLWFLIAFVIVFLSQIASGGRGGSLTVVIGAVGMTLYYRQFKLIIYGAAGIVAFVAAFSDILLKHLRLDRLEAGSSAPSDFSSGRLEQYGLAFDLVRSPIEFFIGLGSKGYEIAFARLGIDYEIHNVWVRLLIEYGIAAPIFVLCYFCVSMIKARSLSERPELTNGILIIIATSLFVTLVEPNAIIFSYQNYMCWWVLFLVVKMGKVDQFLPPQNAGKEH